MITCKHQQKQPLGRKKLRGGWNMQIDSARKWTSPRHFCARRYLLLFLFKFFSFPAIASLAERTLEAAPLSYSHLLYVNQLANRSVSIDVDITTNRHLGT